MGPDILVAPVVTKALARDIYLPRGTWRDDLRHDTIDGPRWLKDYKADLHEVPTFTLISKR